MFTTGPKFSPYVVKALVDAITGGSGNDTKPPVGKYRSGTEIVQFFLDCNLELVIGSSSRVPAVTELIRSVRHRDDGDTLM